MTPTMEQLERWKRKAEALDHALESAICLCRLITPIAHYLPPGTAANFKYAVEQLNIAQEKSAERVSVYEPVRLFGNGEYSIPATRWGQPPKESKEPQS